MSDLHELTPLLYFALGGLTVLLLLGLFWLWKRPRPPLSDSNLQEWFTTVHVIEHTRPQTTPPRYWLWANLTEREMQVARLAAHGHRNADIARFLVLSPGTVTAHLKNIYAKLEVHSRLELANLLREIGEYEDPGP